MSRISLPRNTFPIPTNLRTGRNDIGRRIHPGRAGDKPPRPPLLFHALTASSSVLQTLVATASKFVQNTCQPGEMAEGLSIPFGEKRRLELRWEALNALNHPQFVQVPLTSVNGTPGGRFLNRDFTASGIRSMWVQVKLIY